VELRILRPDWIFKSRPPWKKGKQTRLREQSFCARIPQCRRSRFGVRLRSCEAAPSLKNNQASLGGKPDDSFRPAFAASAVTALNQLAQRHRLLFLIRVHEMKINRENGLPRLGVSPIGGRTPQRECSWGQFDSDPGTETVTAASHRLTIGFERLAAVWSARRLSQSRAELFAPPPATRHVQMA